MASVFFSKELRKIVIVIREYNYFLKMQYTLELEDIAQKRQPSIQNRQM